MHNLWCEVRYPSKRCCLAYSGGQVAVASRRKHVDVVGRNQPERRGKASKETKKKRDRIWLCLFRRLRIPFRSSGERRDVQPEIPSHPNHANPPNVNRYASIYPGLHYTKRQYNDPNTWHTHLFLLIVLDSSSDCH